MSAWQKAAANEIAELINSLPCNETTVELHMILEKLNNRITDLARGI